MTHLYTFVQTSRSSEGAHRCPRAWQDNLVSQLCRVFLPDFQICFLMLLLNFLVVNLLVNMLYGVFYLIISEHGYFQLACVLLDCTPAWHVRHKLVVKHRPLGHQTL